MDRGSFSKEDKAERDFLLKFVAKSLADAITPVLSFIWIRISRCTLSL